MLAINHASTHVTQQPLLVQSLCKGMHSQQHLHYAQMNHAFNTCDTACAVSP